MKKLTKTSIVSLGAAALLLVGGGAGYAASNWAGHANIVQIQLNLDKLANQLSKNKTDLTNAQQALQQATNGQSELQKQLDQAKNDYKALQDQRTADQNSFNDQLAGKQAEIQQKIQEIQDKIKEGNDKVANKQKEVDALNQKVSDLNNQLAEQKQSSDADMAQAIKDAQDTRDKSDQIVNQYVEK
jgi:chromosome segregation ATPase